MCGICTVENPRGIMQSEFWMEYSLLSTWVFIIIIDHRRRRRHHHNHNHRRHYLIYHTSAGRKHIETHQAKSKTLRAAACSTGVGGDSYHTR